VKVPSGKHTPGRAPSSFILSPAAQANYWMDAANDNPSIIADARSGESPKYVYVYPEIDPKMMADIHIALSRLVVDLAWFLIYSTWSGYSEWVSGQVVVGRGQHCANSSLHWCCLRAYRMQTTLLLTTSCYEYQCAHPTPSISILAQQCSVYVLDASMGVAHSEKKNCSHSIHVNTPCGICVLSAFGKSDVCILCSQDTAVSLFPSVQ